MRHAVIDESGKVVNVIELEANAEWSPPAGHTLVQSDNAGIGWENINGVLTAPANVVVQPTIAQQIAALELTITVRRQREALLTDAGKAWLAGIDAQIAALRVKL